MIAFDAERLMLRLTRSTVGTFVELPFAEILSKGVVDYYTGQPIASSTYGLGIRLREAADTERLRVVLRRDLWNLEMQNDRLLVEWAELEPGLKEALAVLPVEETMHTSYGPRTPPRSRVESWDDAVRGILVLVLAAGFAYRYLGSSSPTTPPANAVEVLARQGARDVVWGEVKWNGCGHRGRGSGFRFTAIRQQRRVGGIYCDGGPYVIWDEDRTP